MSHLNLYNCDISLIFLNQNLIKEDSMAKTGGCRPPNGPSTTGNPSGGGRGNCPSK